MFALLEELRNSLREFAHFLQENITPALVKNEICAIINIIVIKEKNMDSRMHSERRHPARQGGPNRRRRRRRKTPPAVWILLALMVLLMAVGIYTMSVVGVGTPKFYSGVNLWGVDLAGYTYEEGRAMMQQMLDEWQGRSFTFTFQEDTWNLKASDVGASLNLDQAITQAWNLGHTGGIFARRDQIESLRKNPIYFTAEPKYDETAIDAFVESVRSKIDCDPVDAEVVLTATRPELVTRSKDGYKLDTEWLKSEIVELIKTGSDNAVIALQVENIEPAVSSNEAAGGLDLLVEVSTSVKDSTANRRKNVDLALSKFNGVAVYPGQLVSFNEVVGKRTKKNGFKEAPEYDGTTVTTGVGGGVCQASTTLYMALLKADFEIIQRQPHNMTIGYAKPSFDATVGDVGGKDLVFLNDTDQVFYFYTDVDSETASVRVYGNRPEYRVELKSVVVTKNIHAKEKNIVKDTEGKYAWYEDEIVLYKEGKTGMRSECYKIYYDWETGEEVRREMVSSDYYNPQPNTYYVGVHTRVDSTEQPVE